MSTVQLSYSHIDLERGSHRRSVVGSEMSDEGSLCFSDGEDGSSYSYFYSTHGGSYDDNSFSCVTDAGDVHDFSTRLSSMSDCSVEVEMESEVSEMKVHLSKIERDCRICHMDMESDSHASGMPIELGCCCKDDLAAAHKHCAETWFKIKGNRICEICRSVARNVFGPSEEPVEHSNDTNSTAAAAEAAVSLSAPTAEARSFWQGHRFLNFLLACMVFAFVISWLFHFNVPSS